SDLRGERRRGTGRDVDRLGRGGAACDEADGDALQGGGPLPAPHPLAPSPIAPPAPGKGGTLPRTQAPEPRCGGGLVVTRIEALAFDGDAGFAEVAKSAVSSGAAGPGLAQHPGGHPAGGGEMPADLPAVGAAVALGEEVEDAGGGAGDGAAAGQDGLVGEVPAGREGGLVKAGHLRRLRDLTPWPPGALTPGRLIPSRRPASGRGVSCEEPASPGPSLAGGGEAGASRGIQ